MGLHRVGHNWVNFTFTHFIQKAFSSSSGRWLVPEPTWQSLPTQQSHNYSTALVWVLTHHPPDWVVSVLWVKPCLVHCTSLFSNEWENPCLLLTENAWVPFSHPIIHHSVGKDTCYPFLFISYWRDISSFDQGHIFLYFFQYLAMVKHHIFNHKYSPWIK